MPRTPLLVALISAVVILAVFLGRARTPPDKAPRVPRSQSVPSAGSPAVPQHSAAPRARRPRLPVRASRRIPALPLGAVPTDGTDDAQFAHFPPEHRAHAAAVAHYISETFAPRLRLCLRHVQPTGDIEVTHSFVVDEDGVAVAAAIPDRTPAPVTIVDTDIDPAHADDVERCFLEAAAGTSFPHAPLNALAPEHSFVAHQVYRFAHAP